MKKDNILNNYKKNGYVILKNFLPNDHVKKLENSITYLINYHAKKEKLRSNLSVDEKIIKLNQIRKQKKLKIEYK